MKNLLGILFPRRRREAEEMKKLDQEIKNLEEQLNLLGRTETEVYYDPFYERNRGRRYDLNGRREYLKDLNKRLTDGYESPEVIQASGYFNPELTNHNLFSSLDISDNDYIKYKKIYLILIRKNSSIVNNILSEIELKTDFLGIYGIETKSECDNLNNYDYIIIQLDKFSNKQKELLKKLIKNDNT